MYENDILWLSTIIVMYVFVEKLWLHRKGTSLGIDSDFVVLAIPRKSWIIILLWPLMINIDIDLRETEKLLTWHYCTKVIHRANTWHYNSESNTEFIAQWTATEKGLGAIT